MSRVDKQKALRFPGKHPPQTAAERQRKCRAIKRGEWVTYPNVAPPLPPGVPIPTNPNLLPHIIAEKQKLALSAPAPSQQPALPAPPSSAIQKSDSAGSTSLALYEGLGGEESAGGASPQLCLPPGVAARLRSLLDKHKAGKQLTRAERDEAEGLLDIAEYFVVQRMRRQLAA